MAAQPISNTPLFSDPNLVAYYEMENVNDSKGSNNLTNVNSVTFTTGLFNLAANFGTSALGNKELSFATGLGVDLSGEWSVTCWVNIATAPTSGQNTIFWDWRSTSGSSRYCILHYENSSGTLTLYIDNSGTSNPSVAKNLATGVWHNIVVQKQADSFTHLYLDNVDLGNSSNAGANAGNGLAIGNVEGGGSLSTSGLIDDVAFFSRALTTAEINGIYNGFTSILSVSGVLETNINTISGVTNANIQSVSGVAN